MKSIIRRAKRFVRCTGLAAGTVLVLLATAACSTAAAAPVPPTGLATLSPAKLPAASAAAGGPQINIENFKFVPADLAVPAGATVTWTNHDDTPHTVTSAEKAFSSPSVETDGQFTFAFSTPGTYAYFCTIHPFMTANVIFQ